MFRSHPYVNKAKKTKTDSNQFLFSIKHWHHLKRTFTIDLHCKLTRLFFWTMNSITISALTKNISSCTLFSSSERRHMCCFCVRVHQRHFSSSWNNSLPLAHRISFSLFCRLLRKNKYKCKPTHSTFRQNIMHEKWGAQLPMVLTSNWWWKVMPLKLFSNSAV